METDELIETSFIPMNPARGGSASVRLGGVAAAALGSSGQDARQSIKYS